MQSPSKAVIESTSRPKFLTCANAYVSLKDVCCSVDVSLASWQSWSVSLGKTVSVKAYALCTSVDGPVVCHRHSQRQWREAQEQDPRAQQAGPETVSLVDVVHGDQQKGCADEHLHLRREIPALAYTLKKDEPWSSSADSFWILYQYLPIRRQ